jgi:hypothetical protein
VQRARQPLRRPQFAERGYDDDDEDTPEKDPPKVEAPEKQLNDNNYSRRRGSRLTTTNGLPMIKLTNHLIDSTLAKQTATATTTLALR